MAETQKLARELPKFILRFSAELRDKIKTAAEQNKRSMTAEIVQLIEEGFEHRAHNEWMEEHYRAIQEDRDVEAAFEQHKRETEEEIRREREEGRRRAGLIFDSPENERRTNMIVPPDGMSRDEMSALLEQALKDSHRRAMDLFQSMVIEKGGRVVPIEDAEDNP